MRSQSSVWEQELVEQAGGSLGSHMEVGMVEAADTHLAAWVEVADSYLNEGGMGRLHVADPRLWSARVMNSWDTAFLQGSDQVEGKHYVADLPIGLVEDSEQMLLGRGEGIGPDEHGLVEDIDCARL